MSFDDDDLKADVERLSAKWIDGAPKRSNLDDEERAIAARLLGSKREADRLASASTKKPYRYRERRPVVAVHYGYIPRGQTDWWGIGSLGDYWYIEIFRNGRKYELMRGDRPECVAAVSRLQRMGFPTTLVGDVPAVISVPKPTGPSRRKQVMDQVGRFKP